MKKMTKVISLALALAMCLALCACGKGESKDTAGDKKTFIMGVLSLIHISEPTRP